jgi:carbon monoxide dehydrogenase subunit G
MAFSFGGEFTVQRTPEETYDFLTDPSRFCPLLPDYQKLDVRDTENFMVDVKVGISHIRGTAAVKLHLAEHTRPSRALYTGKATMAGGNVDLIARFDLRADGGGTVVSWKGEAQVFGRLTSIAGGLLEPLARKNLQKVIASLQQAMNQEKNLTTETPRTQRTTEQLDATTGTDKLGVPR